MFTEIYVKIIYILKREMQEFVTKGYVSDICMKFVIYIYFNKYN